MVLEVRGVQKSYSLGESRVEVLRGVNLKVPPGQLCAVMGPSGVGKSTLLNCVAGLDTPDQGEVVVLDHQVHDLDDQARTIVRRRHIGIVFQFFNLVSNLTALENVTLPFLIEGIAPDLDAIERAIERVGMSRRSRHRPAQLSGGEMQLISIARAIVRKPALLLADEPTGNVNVETGRKIMDLLRAVTRETECAMLMVTHNPEDAARADRVVFMKDGRFEDEATLLGEEVSRASVHAQLEALRI